MEPRGRLELTWTNKHLRLISAANGGYEWVDPWDPRVTEVRLLDQGSTVGDRDDEADNLLIEGDALHALTALNRIPELAERYASRVRLVYIDPPFNTGQAFAHYDDNLEHSVWLAMLRDRLVQLKPLLAPNGSIWVHLDDAEVHRCRVVMDEVLGASGFVASIAWQKRTSRENRAAFASMHDTLLVYAAGGSTRFRDNRNRLSRGEGAFSNPDDDPRGPWASVPFTAQGFRANQMYNITTPTGVVHEPPPGRCWGRVEAEYLRALEDGRVHFPDGGNGRPRLKKYEFEDEGLVPETLWLASAVGTNDDAKRHIMALFPGLDAFATPKPERLMERIVHIATDPGDIVLDCFAGSGTTAAVAHKMGRRWVAVEREQATVDTFTKPRLTKVVNGEDPGGITTISRPASESVAGGLKAGQAAAAARTLKAMFDDGRLDDTGLDEPTMEAVVDAMRGADKTATETVWSGGGAFRHLRVGPSMFDLDVETGEVFLAEWATNGAFADAVSAQLGFSRTDEPPFCGRKGRTRLAVLDGVVGPAEVGYLVAALDDRERLIVVGQAFTEDAEATLRRLSPGSRVRHAPNDLLRQGARR